MQSASDSQANRTVDLAPAIRHSVPWRLVSVTPLPGARLSVAFVDGTVGEVHLSRWLESSRVEGTVFEPLRDPEEFARVRIVMGAVAWPHGADLAPDAMYDAIREHGIWAPEHERETPI